VIGPVLVPHDVEVSTERRLTNFHAPEHLALSGYNKGFAMRHDEWLKCEVKTCHAKGRKVFIVRNTRGELALAEGTP